MHVALYTNLFTSRFEQNSEFCRYCLQVKGKICPEDNIHLFFECSLASKVWRKVLPLLRLIMNTQDIRRTSILFNTFPSGTPIHIQKLAFTTSQIILQRVWLNRNDYQHQKQPDINTLFFISNSIFHLSLELLAQFWKTRLKVA